MATERRVAIAAAVGLRGDYGALRVYGLAKRSDDADQTRRLLALAAIYNGGSRSEAAKIGGVGLQAVRDWVLALGADTFGIIGCAVGSSFAVLVAEQLFLSGCQFLVSITSAGQIIEADRTPYVVIIDRALRDEGTSYHYLPPAQFAAADSGLTDFVELFVREVTKVSVRRGPSWTTDAPFRETRAAVAAARERGILAVEMEAAALYVFAAAKAKPVICFAHVTNMMGQSEGDFEKGEANGTATALEIIAAAGQAWPPPDRNRDSSEGP